jgi:hypothetical protein
MNERDEDSKNLNQALGSYYYSSTDYGGRNVGKIETMAVTEGSIPFVSQKKLSLTEYPSVTTLPEDYEFEFEKIKPNEKNGKNITLTEVIENQMSDFGQTINNTSQDQLTHPSISSTGLNKKKNNNNENQGKISKLLFSSPSATVESNGPSGPFKAIICHDCENSKGRNVGHSVSFSAIKSWNVGGKSKVTTLQLEADSNHTTSVTTTLVKETVSHQQHPVENPVPTLMLPSEEKYLDENEQIEVHDNVELFKVTNSATEKPSLPTRNWNFSSSWHLGTNTNIAQRKPIFTDLLKVPYDVLNAPLTESPSTTSTSTTTTTQLPQDIPINQQSTIHINHQQKFNDTITSNYQHFQQFIHKNLDLSQSKAQQNSLQEQQPINYQSTSMPEQNYEVDESVSLMTNGRVHGVQSTSSRITTHNENQNMNQHHIHHHQQNKDHQFQTSDSDDEDGQGQDAKFGYVVEGRNFRKYRVEEKTSDGFIVG